MPARAIWPYFADEFAVAIVIAALKLQGRMRDAQMLHFVRYFSHDPLRFAYAQLAANYDVSRERVCAARDAPDVQVVHRKHTVHAPDLRDEPV